MKLGDIVEGYCSSCKLNLDVSVAAVVEEVVKQVQCRTCGNFVNYKPPVDLVKKKAQAMKRLMRMQEKKRKEAAKTGAEASAPPAVEVQRWKELTDPVMSWHAKPYDKHRQFKAEQFILHKKEGMGHVESAEENEIIVLFKGGLVSLPHNEPRDE